MPYKSIGTKVYVKKDGWKVKTATAQSPASAKRMVNLLRGIKHGFKPTKRK